MDLRNFFSALIVLLFLFPFSAGFGEEGPREIAYTLFARLPKIEKIALSPDGQTLAILYPAEGETRFTIFDIRKNPENKPLPFKIKFDITWVGWANNDRLLISQIGIGYVLGKSYITLTGGLIAFDKDGTNSKKLLGHRSVNKHFPSFLSMKVLSTLPDDHENILIQLQKPEDKTPGVYKLNVYTGDLTEVEAPMKGMTNWAVDYDKIVRLGWGEREDEPVLIARTSATSEWIEIQNNDIFEDGEFQLLGFGFDASSLFFRSSLNTGRAAIYEFDFLTGMITRKVFDDPVYDVDGLVLSISKKQISAGKLTADFPELVPLNPDFEKWQGKISQALGGLRFQIMDSTPDEQFFIIRSFSEKDPGSLYLLDGVNNELSPIWEVLPSLFPENMNEVRKVTYFARDGLGIEAYLTIPKGSEGKNLPTVIILHGGPWVRDSMIFNAQTQFLANRGFAVFQPNFRGSSGYGKTFLELGYGEWGGKMQLDIQDGLAWLVRNGIANPDKVCLLGASYGGYAALMALAQFPDDYECAIALAPVTDLNLLLKELRGNSSEKFITKAIKNKMDKRDLMRLSPYKVAKDISDPILLLHGTLDRIIPFEHSDKMAKALEKANKDVRLIPLQNSGHDLFHEKTRLKYFREIEKFLKKHIGQPENANADGGD